MTGVGASVREGALVLKVVQNGSESNEESSEAAGGSLLDEIVRDGARQMLAAALQAEVAAYVDGFADEVDEQGHRLVVACQRDGTTSLPGVWDHLEVSVSITGPRFRGQRRHAG